MDKSSDKQGKNTGHKNVIPWKPGQSGNPNGRPPKGDAWSDIYNEILDSKEIDLEITNINDKGEEKTKKINLTSKRKMRYALGVALLKEGLKGNVTAIKELSDRTVGRAVQKVNINEVENLDDKLKRAVELMDFIDESNGVDRPTSDSETISEG